jgi:hypothetical protein
LALDLSGQPVGTHRLRVRVADVAGNEADVYDGEIAVAGPDPAFTPTVTLKVGDPRPAAPGGNAQGAGSPSAPGTVPQCLRPQLSMALDQRPLSVKRGRPVLRSKASASASAGGSPAASGRCAAAPRVACRWKCSTASVAAPSA